MPMEIANSEHRLNIDGVPDECPICHHAVEPLHIGFIRCDSNTAGSNPGRVDVAYACPRSSCRRMFVGRYVHGIGGVDRKLLFVLDSTVPFEFTPPTVEAEIQNLSPNFVQIISQAAHAETLGLTEISGMGYRKALEFLMKDYCIHKEPGSEANIRTKFLGRVISDHVEDPRIIACAERAAWLGNDETHYERRWQDRDISDLKTLIRLTSNWIVSDVLTEQYGQDMQQ